MSTAPTFSASPARLVRRVQVGELITTLAIHTGYAASGGITAAFVVGHGRVDAPLRAWSVREFPFTAEGEADALAKHDALVSAAAMVQA